MHLKTYSFQQNFKTNAFTFLNRLRCTVFTPNFIKSEYTSPTPSTRYAGWSPQMYSELLEQ